MVAGGKRCSSRECHSMHGFVAVYCEGYDRRWQCGRRMEDWKKRPDDAEYLKSVIDRERKAVEEREEELGQVFLIGHSNGGFMAVRFAQLAPAMVRGIAPICAGIATNVHDAGGWSEGVAACFFLGSEDKLVPLNGGPIGKLRGAGEKGNRRGLGEEDGGKIRQQKNGERSTSGGGERNGVVMSWEEAAIFLASVNHLEYESVLKTSPPALVQDGTTVEKYLYKHSLPSHLPPLSASTSSPNPLAFFIIRGHGHPIPGSHWVAIR